MKRLLALTIPLLLLAGTVGATYAYAEEEAIYPEDSEFVKTLSFSSLTDFAVGEDSYSFAENDTVYIYSDGELTKYEHGDAVCGLDYDGGYIFTDGEKSYSISLPDGEPVAEELDSEHTFTAYTIYTYGGAVYRIKDGALQYCPNESDIFTDIEGLGGEVSSFKLYGSAIYTLSGNKLYRVDGATAEEIALEYSDYSAAASIPAGNTAELLKDYTLSFVTVDKGAYMTEVDLSDLSDTFNPDGSAATVKTDKSLTALLLCYTGNAAIVSVGYESYITLRSHTHEISFSYADNKEFENATVVGDRIYSSPFVADATVLLEAAGTTVEVVNKLVYEDVLGCVFYEVRYGDGNIGYVAEGFLTNYIFEDNRDPAEIPDENYSEDNNIRTVLLVLAVVVLVMIAAKYITFVATSEKRKGKTPPDDKES